MSLGSTIVTGRAVTTDKVTGQKIVISESSVRVHVVKLEGLKIKAPVQRLRVGSELPLTAHGATDPTNQNPYAFGSAVPQLNFAWSVNQAHLASLFNPFAANEVRELQKLMCISNFIHLLEEMHPVLDRITGFKFDPRKVPWPYILWLFICCSIPPPKPSHEIQKIKT